MIADMPRNACVNGGPPTDTLEGVPTPRGTVGTAGGGKSGMLAPIGRRGAADTIGVTPGAECGVGGPVLEVIPLEGREGPEPPDPWW